MPAVLLFLLVTTTSATAQDRAADEKAIRAHVAATERAINAQDAAAVASLFAADGDEIVEDGPHLVGRDAIRNGSETAFAAQPRGRFSLRITGVRFLAPDVAIVDTVATFTQGPVRSNRGTMVMVREDRQWLIKSLRVYPAERAIGKN